MAVTVTSGPIGEFDPYTRDTASFFQKLRYADGSSGTAAQRATAQAELEQKADFSATFTTSNTDALANVFALSGSSGQGVTFPAGTVRCIKMTLRSANDADRWYQEVEQDVYGSDGTTPVLGDQRLIRAYGLDAAVFEQQGEVNLVTSEAMAEATDGTNSTGIAGGALSSSASAITFPPCRAVQVLGLAVMQDAFDAATGGEARLSALNPAAGTATITQVAGDDGLATNAPAGEVHAHLRLWPLPQVALALSTNDVQVHAHSALNDVLTHRVDVSIGKAKIITLGA